MTTEYSVNGWSVLEPDSTRLHTWRIPASTGSLSLTLRVGRPGFVLAHYVLWHAEKVETLAGAGDDFGYSHRYIALTTDWSNHASGTAMDLNASSHPQGRIGTYTEIEAALIRSKMGPAYDFLLKWGGDFRSTVDEMHFEIASHDLDMLRVLCTSLITSPRGRRLLAANPSQVKYLP